MMRLPWWPNEPDEVTPESVRQELDDLLIKLQRYEHRLNDVVKRPGPRDRPKRKGPIGE